MDNFCNIACLMAAWNDNILYTWRIYTFTFNNSINCSCGSLIPGAETYIKVVIKIKERNKDEKEWIDDNIVPLNNIIFC